MKATALAMSITLTERTEPDRTVLGASFDGLFEVEDVPHVDGAPAPDDHLRDVHERVVERLIARWLRARAPRGLTRARIEQLAQRHGPGHDTDVALLVGALRELGFTVAL